MHFNASLSISSKAQHHYLLHIDMCQSVNAVPPPAVELTLEPDTEPQVGGVRLDLDGAVLRCKRPQGTVTVLDLELRNPEEVAPRLWEERHRPLKILDRRVGVQTQLNEPPLQPEERHCLVEGGHQSRQDHDLFWGRQGALHQIPKHPLEREVGCGDEDGLLPIDDEACLDQQRERAFCRLAIQLWKVRRVKMRGADRRIPRSG
jgi:hypothetical protein